MDNSTASPVNIYSLFYRFKRLSGIIVALVILAGVSALLNLPRQEDPTITRRMANVVTLLPGASANIVEAQVTKVVEGLTREIPEISESFPESRPNISVIQLRISDEVTDVAPIWSRVRSKLVDAVVDLPANASTPELRERSAKASTLLLAFRWKHSSPPQHDILTEFAKKLETELLNINKTEETHIYGGVGREVSVLVEPKTLSAMNITLNEIALRIGQFDSSISAGSVKTQASNYRIEFSSQLDGLDRIRSIPINNLGGNGFVYLDDIAEIEWNTAQQTESIAMVNRDRVVVLEAKMQDGERIDRWTKRADQRIANFRDRLPDNIELTEIFRQQDYVDKRLEVLAFNFVTALAIVAAVLFLMMGWKSALIVCCALPISLLVALIGFRILGFSLDQISITGLIVALGLLIDSAIVTVNGYNLQRADGNSILSSIHGVGAEFFAPLLASTLTTIFAFLPMALAPGGAGEFVGPMATAVIFTVLSAFLTSIFLVPAFAGLLDSKEKTGNSNSHWWQVGISAGPFLTVFCWSLRLVLRKPMVGIAFSISISISGFVIWAGLEEQFFPPTDRNMFQVQLEMAPQSSIETTKEAVLRMQDILDQYKEVVDSHLFIGESSPRVFYNMLGVRDGIEHVAGGWVTTTSAKAAWTLLKQLQLQLREEMPDGTVLAVPFEQGPPAEAPIELVIKGEQKEQLRSLSLQIRGILQQVPSVTFTKLKSTNSTPKINLEILETEALASGLNPTSAAHQLRTNLDGVSGGRVIGAGSETDINVRLTHTSRSKVDSVLQSTFISPGRFEQITDTDQESVPGTPLSAIAESVLQPEALSFIRRDGSTANIVQGYITPYALASVVQKDFFARFDDSGIKIPAGFSIEVGGESADRSDAIGAFLSIVPPLLILLVGTIVLSFNSFKYAGYIGLVAMLGAGMGFLAVGVFGYPRGFLPIIGTLGLIGIAINDSIIVLAQLKNNQDKIAEFGLPVVEKVVMHETRHVFSTTLTTMGGFIPLIFFGGDFWPPLAIAIGAGVAGATILSLYFIPALYILDNRRRILSLRTPELTFT